jgi:hypothetical protein
MHKSLLWLLLLTACRVLAIGPAPVIVVQPLGSTVLNSGTALFTVVATSGTTMTYQWTKNGQDIWGATSSTYTILSATANDAGSYAVKVTNAGGTVTSSSATLVVVSAPVITSQPQSQSVMKAGTFTLAVGANGTGPLTYLWIYNGGTLSGATSSSLTISNLSNGRAGTYYAVVSNPYGSATSSVATITMLVPLEITKQPTNQIVTTGSEVRFIVSAAGNGTMQYQWSFKGSLISGATNSTLNIKSAQPEYAGNYSVKVTDSTGSVTSSPARLTLIAPAPSLATGNLPTSAGGPFTFSYAATAGFTYVIEATSDFQTWIPISTNASASGAISFSDSSAVNYSTRFYRVIASSQ